MSVENVEELLREHGLRATPQRMTVVMALTHLSHPDADAVYSYARGRLSSMSLATVYNVLDKLRQVGLITMLDLHGRRYFDLRVEPHDHVRCRNCGQLLDVARDPGTRLVMPSVASWMIENQELVWEGLCPSCRQA